MATEYLVPDSNATPGTLFTLNDYTEANNTIASADSVVGFRTGIDDQTATAVASVSLTSVVGGPATCVAIYLRVRARFQSWSNDDNRYTITLRDGSGTYRCAVTFASISSGTAWTPLQSSVPAAGSYNTSELASWYVTIAAILFSSSKGKDGSYLEIDEIEVEVQSAAGKAFIYNSARRYAPFLAR